MFEAIELANQALLAMNASQDVRYKIMMINNYLAKMSVVALQIYENPDSVTIQNTNEQTPLHVCVNYGLFEAAKLILESNKVQVDAKDCLGMTPFHWSILKKNYGLASLLVRYGADVDSIDGRDEKTALISAVYRLCYCELPNEEIKKQRFLIGKLLKWGASCHSRDEEDSPLTLLSKSKFPDFIEVFLNYGAGIGFDFDYIFFTLSGDERTRFHTMLKEASKNKLLIFSRCTKFELDSSAFTTIEDLENAVTRGVHFKFKNLINTVEKMFKNGIIKDVDREKYEALLQTIKKCQNLQDARRGKSVSSLFKLATQKVAQNLITNKITEAQLVTLPEELKEKIEKERIVQTRANKHG